MLLWEQFPRRYFGAFFVLWTGLTLGPSSFSVPLKEILLLCGLPIWASTTCISCILFSGDIGLSSTTADPPLLICSFLHSANLFFRASGVSELQKNQPSSHRAQGLEETDWKDQFIYYSFLFKFLIKFQLVNTQCTIRVGCTMS